MKRRWERTDSWEWSEPTGASVRCVSGIPRLLQDRALISAPHFTFKSGSEPFDGGRWFADHRNRYVGWQTLDAYPMIALVGLDQQAVLARYRSVRDLFIRYAILATLAVFSGAFVAMTFSLRLAARRHQLELPQEAYRMATEKGIEGFYIVRPVRDRRGAIVDFKLIDCNSRGAELFRLRRDELVGRPVSVLAQRLRSDQLVGSLHTAMTAGSCVPTIRWLSGCPTSATQKPTSPKPEISTSDRY